jgi:hypothetical protein
MIGLESSSMFTPRKAGTMVLTSIELIGNFPYSNKKILPYKKLTHELVVFRGGCPSRDQAEQQNEDIPSQSALKPG